MSIYVCVCVCAKNRDEKYKMIIQQLSRRHFDSGNMYTYQSD